jgi:hypothetical protein
MLNIPVLEHYVILLYFYLQKYLSVGVRLFDPAGVLDLSTSGNLLMTRLGPAFEHATLNEVQNYQYNGTHACCLWSVLSQVRALSSCEICMIACTRLFRFEIHGELSVPRGLCVAPA